MGFMRTWLIRLVILSVLALGGGGLWYLNEWVSPERVREALIAALREKLPGVEVQVESAGLRLFGGVTVKNLQLKFPGEAEPFFVASSAVISHDKESLSRGVLELRKIELNDSVIRIVRKADGTWNVAGLMKSKAGGDLPPLPTLDVKNAVVVLLDERTGASVPPLVLHQFQLQLVNDPIALLKIDAGFTVSPWVNGAPAPSLAIPLTVNAKVNRLDDSFTARIEIPDLVLTPELAPALARLDPAVGDTLSQCQAHLGIKAELKREAKGELKHDIRIDVKDGRFEDEHLPRPLEQISGAVHIKDGKVKVERATARLGKAVLELTLETRAPAAAVVEPGVPLKLPATVGASADPLEALADKLDKLQVTVRELAIDDELFAKLPPSAHKTRRLFSPNGTVDISLGMTRTPAGMRQELEVRPNRAGMTYEKFRYPIQDLAGFVRKVSAPDLPEEFRVQVTGTAGGRRVELKGRVGADGLDPLIDLTLTGIDIPIDDKLFAAMPAKYSTSLGKLRAGGRGDFSVEIRQAEGVNKCESTIRVNVHDGQVHYDHFRYPLRKIRGQVTIRIAAISPDRPLRPGLPHTTIVDTDRVELRNFKAMHGDGLLTLDGDSDPVFGTNDRVLKLRVTGENLPFDSDFKTAVEGLPVGDLWQMLSPRGTFTFGADVEVIERGTPKPTNIEVLSNPAGRVIPAAAAATLPGEPPFRLAEDLKLTINFKGPTITPEFFRYELENVAGIVRYAGGQVELAWLNARHGTTVLTLDAGKVILADSGELWANLGGLQVRPLILDAPLLAALPARMRDDLKELKLRGPMDLNVKHLVVSVPKKAPPPPTTLTTHVQPKPIARAQAAHKADAVFYWNAELKMHGVNFDTGTEWSDVHGTIASVGKYDLDHLDAVLGNAWFDRLTVAKQPITNAKFSYRARPQMPDAAMPGRFTPIAIEFPDISANAYQGTLGGEAWVSLGEQPQYRLWLTAAGVRLDELATSQQLAKGGELRGLAQAKVLLESKPDAKTGLRVLTGSGQIDIPNGRLYNMPVMLPLLKLMKLQTPDQTAFEEAHALFTLVGDRITVTQLDLIGTALSLGGSGELDTRGDEVKFEFYTVWSQALKRWLTTPLGDVQSFLSGNLFRIEMTKIRGGTMEYRPQMLPVVTDPVKAVAERLRNRFGQQPAR